MICNYTQHMENDIWQKEAASAPPLDVFWGRRFLSNPNTSTHKADSESACQNSDIGPDGQTLPENVSQFTGEGLATQFLPFGMGERMCPGRHFAKTQTLLAFALMVKTFDIELLVGDDWKPSLDWKYFGLGTMPPATLTPFRIRRKSSFAA